MEPIFTSKTEENLGVGMPNIAAINRRMLLEIAAWTKDEVEIFTLFGETDPTAAKKLKNQMNRDLTRVVMLVLANEALSSDRQNAEIFSLRKLATVLDQPRVESMQRTLKKWLLPMLADAGWIDGFVTTLEWSTSPHEIEITTLGLEGVIAYLQECQDIADGFEKYQTSLH